MSVTTDQASRAAAPTVMFPEPCAHCGMSSFVPKTRQLARSERVGKLLKVNDPPHDAEKAALRGIIQAALATLSEYDEKLALLRSDMDLLTEEREKLLMHVDDGQKLLHPFRSTPDDILREVFAYCIPDLNHLNDYSSLNSRNAPWSLSQVSSRWRRVVLSTPSLWTTLSFAFPKSMEPSHSDVAALARFSYNLTLFLSRSKDCSLTVHLQCPIIGEIEIHPLVLNTLQVSALRWSHLHFMARRFLLSALLEMSFERLENLLVIESAAPERIIQQGDFRAPVLRSVRVVGGDLGGVPLPWKTLTTYECSSSRYMNAGRPAPLAHLVSMSALEQLTIRYFVPVTAIFQLSLPRLWSLTLTSDNPRAYSDFLPKLSAPGLKQLSLTYELSSIVLPNVPTLIHQLRFLTLAIYVATTDTCVKLHTWLQQAVNVTRFSLTIPFIAAELLDRLVVREDDSKTALLPKLELLQLTLKPGQNWDNLRSQLDSRKGHCVIELNKW